MIGVESTWNEIKEAVKSMPTMVFSVIGDSENFVSRPWPRTVFQTALIEASKSGVFYSKLSENSVYSVHLVSKRIHIQVKPEHDSQDSKDTNIHVPL